MENTQKTEFNPTIFLFFASILVNKFNSCEDMRKSGSVIVRSSYDNYVKQEAIIAKLREYLYCQMKYLKKASDTALSRKKINR